MLEVFHNSFTKSNFNSIYISEKNKKSSSRIARKGEIADSVSLKLFINRNKAFNNTDIP